MRGVTASREARVTERLAEEQAALRRVATLVARGVPPDEVFTALTEEVGRLLPVEYAAMGRYEPDGMVTVASWGRTGNRLPVGGRWPLVGKNVSTLVFETGRPARVDSFADASGPIGVAAREYGIGSGVGSPLIVEGRVWGVMAAYSSLGQPLSADTEARLANFTELLATAIANAESRAGLARLTEEQAALRRVATLVARGVPAAEVFSAIAQELARLLDAQSTTIGRLEPDRTTAIVANHGISRDELPVGTHLPLDRGMAVTEVLRTGRSAFIDDFSQFTDAVQQRAQRLQLRCILGVPIVVEGSLWGSIGAAKQWEDFPADAEQRMAQFTELAATAIANAEGRSELAASRARSVAASDEARRRLARDLHDGAQQRLVSIGLTLRHAQHELDPAANGTAATLEGALGEVTLAIEELRELARGVRPAKLDDGLAPALRELAGRAPLAVEVRASTERFPPHIEAAAYFIACEGLTNAVKHAAATKVTLSARNDAGFLVVSVSDDGKGGAAPSAEGSGLRGLADRAEAHGGSLLIESGRGAGTTLRAELPCAS